MGLQYDIYIRMQCIKKVHIHACKHVLDVRDSACNNDVLGNLGGFSMDINTAKRSMKYWLRVLKLPNHGYPKSCYKMLKFYDSIGYTNWATSIRNNLYMNGFGYTAVYERLNQLILKGYFCLLN